MRKFARTRREFMKQAAIFSASAALASCTQPTAAPQQQPAQGGEATKPPSAPAASGEEVQPGVPRNECLILENPTGTVLPADDFNRWRSGSNTYSTGFQQLALDALWYIDPDAGVKGVWDNALAAEKPIYNADYTQMTVKLRQGLMWSDGVEFTGDDLFYTVDVQMKTPGFNSTGVFNGNIDHMEQPDKYTVVFFLKAPNSRFHSVFTVRWGAVFMMPKHIFEKEADPLAFKFNPPISLGAYTLKDFDPNGKWFLWQRRDDWKKTSVALLGDVDVKYAMYIDPGPSDKRVIAQKAHQLDVIHDSPPKAASPWPRPAQPRSAGSSPSPGGTPIPPCQPLSTITKNQAWTRRKSAGR